MPRWTRRRLLLVLLAAGNLVVWGVVAFAVSLIASDRLDLGIESSVREYQATAIAAWSAGRPGAAAAGTGEPERDLRPRLLSAGSGTPDELAAASLSASPQPATLLGELTPAAATAGGATPGPSADPNEDGSTLGAGADRPAGDEPQSSAPLILADPVLDDLTSLDQEMARSAPGRVVQIRYLETTLNDEISALLASRTDLPYENTHVDLGTEQVIVGGDVRVFGLAIHAEVRGNIVAQDCAPQFETSSVKIGRFFTPVVIRDKVKELLDAALDWYPVDYPLCIEGIVVQQDRVTLYGRRR